MIRRAFRGLVVAAGVALLMEAAAAQQQAALDRVWVRGKEKSVDGKLVLTPNGLVVQSVGADGKADPNKATPVNYADVLRVRPGELPGVNRDDMTAPLALEEKDNRTKKDYETARGLYAALLKKAGNAPVESRRHLEYRVAMMSTRTADASADDDRWAELADAAIKEWAGFLTEYKNGWEVWPAAKTLARLNVELGKYDEAAKLWSRVAKNTDLPAELRAEAGVQEVDALFRGRAFANAATAAEAALKSATGVAKDKLAIYARAARAAEGGLNADSVKPVIEEIEKAIAATKEPAVRGVGYGVIGELNLVANRPRDAMWAFLWVETVYGVERDEALKAMCRLVEVFKSLADEDRPRAYREKIRRYRANF